MALTDGIKQKEKQLQKEQNAFKALAAAKKKYEADAKKNAATAKKYGVTAKNFAEAIKKTTEEIKDMKEAYARESDAAFVDRAIARIKQEDDEDDIFEVWSPIDDTEPNQENAKKKRASPGAVQQENITEGKRVKVATKRFDTNTF